MARAKTGYRIVIQLDSRIALEVILLNRLERLPEARRQEWLRGLLMQGFRGECQALRGAPNQETTRRPSLAFTHGMTSKTRLPVAARDQELVAMNEQTRVINTAAKPFTALGKVIG